MSKSTIKLSPMKKSMLCCPLTSKSTDICLEACKRCLNCAYFSLDSYMTTFTGERNIIDRELMSWKSFEGSLKLKTASRWICFLHSNGTHSLQKIHCFDVMLNFSKSVLKETNSSTSLIARGRVHYNYTFKLEQIKSTPDYNFFFFLYNIYTIHTQTIY